MQWTMHSAHSFKERLVVFSPMRWVSSDGRTYIIAQYCLTRISTGVLSVTNIIIVWPHNLKEAQHKQDSPNKNQVNHLSETIGFNIAELLPDYCCKYIESYCFLTALRSKKEL